MPQKQTCEEVQAKWEKQEIPLSAYLVEMTIAMIDRGDNALDVQSWIDKFLFHYYQES